ncbi:hypothetical protein TNCV_924561, partial [Trichonephila clavipes]
IKQVLGHHVFHKIYPVGCISFVYPQIPYRESTYKYSQSLGVYVTIGHSEEFSNEMHLLQFMSSCNK